MFIRIHSNSNSVDLFDFLYCFFFLLEVLESSYHQSVYLMRSIIFEQSEIICNYYFVADELGLKTHGTEEAAGQMSTGARAFPLTLSEIIILPRPMHTQQC